MQEFVVRFRINGVWNNSDPFRTREEAQDYFEHLNRRGGVTADRVNQVDVQNESLFARSG